MRIDVAAIGRIKAAVLFGQKHQRITKVWLGKCHLLGALRRDRHRRDDGIVLTRLESWNDTIPVLRHDLTRHLHVSADGIGNIDIKPAKTAISIGIVERRISTFGTDTQHFTCRSSGGCVLRVIRGGFVLTSTTTDQRNKRTYRDKRC